MQHIDKPDKDHLNGNARQFIAKVTLVCRNWTNWIICFGSSLWSLISWSRWSTQMVNSDGFKWIRSRCCIRLYPCVAHNMYRSTSRIITLSS